VTSFRRDLGPDRALIAANVTTDPPRTRAWPPKRGRDLEEGSEAMLWMLVVLLLLFWLFGAFVANVGSLIHVLLVIAVVVLVYNLLTRGRATI